MLHGSNPSDGSNVLNSVRDGQPGVRDDHFRLPSLPFQTHHEMAERDSHVDLLQVACLFADIALVPLFIEVEIATRDDDPPGLFVDGGWRPPHNLDQF